MENIVTETINRLLKVYSIKYKVENVLNAVSNRVYVTFTLLIMFFMFLLASDRIDVNSVLIIFLSFLFWFIIYLSNLILNQEKIYNFVIKENLSEIETISFNLIKTLNLMKLLKRNKMNSYLFYLELDKAIEKIVHKEIFYDYVCYAQKRIFKLNTFELTLLSLISLNSNLLKLEDENLIIKTVFATNNTLLIRIMQNKSRTGNKSIFYIEKYKNEVRKLLGE